MNAEIVNSLPGMDMNELMFLLGRHEKYENLLDKTWIAMPIGKLN